MLPSDWLEPSYCRATYEPLGKAMNGGLQRGMNHPSLFTYKCVKVSHSRGWF